MSWWARARQAWRGLAWRGPTYPLFRQELQYWDQRLGGRWRFEEISALLTLISLSLLPASLLMFPGLLLAFALVDEAIGLFFAAAGAGLIAREREAQTWSILRTTALSGAEIAAGKLGGLLYLAWDGVRFLSTSRWLGTLLAVPLFGLLLTLPHSNPLAPGQSALLVLAALVLSYLAFVYRPLVSLVYGGCLGLTASTLTASTGRSMAVAMLLAVLTLGAGAGALAWSVHAFDLAALFSGSVVARLLQRVFLWLIPLSASVLLRLVLVPVFFGLAVHRIQRLAD